LEKTLDPYDVQSHTTQWDITRIEKAHTAIEEGKVARIAMERKTGSFALCQMRIRNFRSLTFVPVWPVIMISFKNASAGNTA